jgi:hypothetical protein
MSVFELFWNLRQQQQIGSATTTATVAASDARAQQAALADLSSRVERLALVTQAVSELLAERAQVSEADLIAKIHDIDMRDGVRDGRAAESTRSCPKCHRPNPGRRTTCLYCGAPLGAAKPFVGL